MIVESSVKLVAILVVPMLDKLFPGETKLESSAQVTPAIVRRATKPVNCWGALNGASLTTVTIDIEFDDSEMDYLFACEFNIDGKLDFIDIES